MDNELVFEVLVIDDVEYVVNDPNKYPITGGELRGFIDMHANGQHTYYQNSVIIYNPAPNINYTYTYPSKTGTFAMTSDIPTNLSDLNSDADHRTVSDDEKSAWNDKSDFSGSFNDLSDVPSLNPEITNSYTSGVAVQVPQNTGTQLLSIDLEPGNYMIIISCRSNKGNTDGSRRVTLSTTSGSITGSSAYAFDFKPSSASYTYVVFTTFYSTGSARTLYINGWQDSDTSLSMLATARAIKLN